MSSECRYSDGLAKVAIPGVSALIAFLSYSSQYLFSYIEPGPLSKKQLWKFNILVACIWISYVRTCLSDPGRVPKDWQPQGAGPEENHKDSERKIRQRFCRKCEAIKPPRSHHCKVCKRCIPKMDHHCPWTANCVSHHTWPHFMRFLFYATTSMIYLQYFIYIRAARVWEDKHMPSYLGPSAWQMAHLFALIIFNFLTLFMVGIMFLRAIYTLSTNVTTIEGWELERHDQLLRRARVMGGYLDGPDGIRVQIVKHEFPYDIGIWQNIRDGMGTSNIIAWFWPFARSMRTDGLAFETNGFEEPEQTWPPPDPDRMPRLPRERLARDAFVYRKDLTAKEELQAFKQRQAEDLTRRGAPNGLLKRKQFTDRFDPDTLEPVIDDYLDDNASDLSGEEGWQDSGGNRLKDYGVEEDVEFYDEDDIPIAELLRRREMRKQRDMMRLAHRSPEAFPPVATVRGAFNDTANIVPTVCHDSLGMLFMIV